MTAADHVSAPSAGDWTAVCRFADLTPERGVAALVDGHQVALFRTVDDMLHAVDNRDPYSGANVLSRGIVGSAGDAPTVASPVYKQVFDLRTGRCLSGDAGSDGPGVAVHGVRLSGAVVEVQVIR